MKRLHDYQYIYIHNVTESRKSTLLAGMIARREDMGDNIHHKEWSKCARKTPNSGRGECVKVSKFWVNF